MMFSRICSTRTLGFSAKRSIQHAVFSPRRQYAKIVDDKNNTQYFLAADPKEAERLKLNQEVIRDYMKGKLVEADLDLNRPGLRILDSATASGKYMLAVYFAALPISPASAFANHFLLFACLGVWLQDLKSSLGEAKGNTYIGTDLNNLYFPQSPVPGIHFQTQSMKDPWPANWNGTFDLFHQRMALPAAGKKEIRGVLKNMTELLKPGGWVQLVEADFSVYDGPAAEAVYRVVSSVFDAMETGVDYGSQLESWFKELGLERVGCKIIDLPLGKKNPNQDMQAKSAKCWSMASKAVADVCKSKSSPV